MKVMHQKTGVQVHVGTMSRALKQIGARRGRPRPIVGCPWSKQAKKARLRALDRLVEALRPEDTAVYLDEVDIHLNPKIGPDWMNQGTQKEVLTPGKNVKRYVCGALDAVTDKITWVAGARKTSQLFIDTLKALAQAYAGKERIHVILDNFRIHDSKAAQAAVAVVGRQDRVALSAAVLSGRQPHRTGVAGPARRGDAYAELAKRGVDEDLAAQTAGSCHGPWRISKSPALSLALPNRLWELLGIERILLAK